MSFENQPGITEGLPTFKGLNAGQYVGGRRYLLTRELGKGGMGVVWLARDELLRDDVALKFLPTMLRSDVTALDDLRQETLKSRKLAHPNIIRIHDLFEAKDEEAFISMEYVDGPTLAVRRLQNPLRVLEWEELSRLVRQLCEALEYAHHEQVVHRDLKPSNLMLDPRQRIKLADFGIARVMTDSVTRITMHQRTSGTLAYMSPQQLNGESPNLTDDIYSAGATIYELLTSKPPFHSGDLSHQVRYVRPDLVSERLTKLHIPNKVPGAVDEAIALCLEKDPNLRPRTARELRERLGLLDGTQGREGKKETDRSVAVEPPPPPTSKKGLRTVAVALGAVALVCVAGALWWFHTHGSGSVPPVPAPMTNAPAITGTETSNAPPAIVPAPAPVADINPTDTNVPAAIIPSNVVVAPPLPSNNPAASTNAAGENFPTAGSGWTNSLQMPFVPLPGMSVLMAVWKTRVVDFEAFVTNSGYSESAKWRDPDVILLPQYPVANVNYQDAAQFCQWLTKTERGKGVLRTNQTYRLPTDREWSHAVGLDNEQGGTPRQRNEGVLGKFPWGEAWPPPSGAGNFQGKEVQAHSQISQTVIQEYDDGYPLTSPVGSFKPNPFGIFDMAGNVWEWCQDIYDPPEPERVLRGGAYDTYDKMELLSSHRYSLGEILRLPDVGFRCVLETQEASAAGQAGPK